MAFIIDRFTSVTANAKAPHGAGSYLYRTTDVKATVTASDYFLNGYTYVPGPGDTLVVSSVPQRTIDKFVVGDRITVQVVDTSDNVLDDFVLVIATIDYSGTSPSITTTVTDSSISGPGTSTDNAAVRWNGTAGNSIQNSVVIIGDTGVVTGITDLTATGTATLSSLVYPTTDGTNGQAILTDGSGNLSFGDAGTGDVVGPASSTDNALALFDGTDGKLLQDSVVTLDQYGNFNSSNVLTLAANSGVYFNGGAGALKWPSSKGTNGQLLQTDGDQICYWVDSTAANPNLIINGSMTFAQRGTSFSSAADGIYSLDRWIYNKSTSGANTISQSSTVPATSLSNYNFAKSYNVNCTSTDSSVGATDVVSFAQRIEGIQIASLVNSSFTFSFWAQSSVVTGVFCAYATNSGKDRSAVVEFTIPDNDWHEYSLTFPAFDLSSGTWATTIGTIGLEVGICLMAGSNFQTTPGAWNTGNFRATSNQSNFMSSSSSNNFTVTGARVQRGDRGSPFFERTYPDERNRCYRFYQSSPTDTAATTIWSQASGAPQFSHSAAVCFANVQYQIEKCKNGTVTVYDRVPTSNKVAYYTGSWNDGGTVGAINVNSYGFTLEHTIASSTATAFHWIANCEI